jgi:predicted PurR-regulated permease PerM
MPSSWRLPWPTLTTLAFLLGVLFFHLLGALLAGLLVHQLVHHLAARWHNRVGHNRARALAVAAMAAVVILGVAGAIGGLMDFLNHGAGLPGLSHALMDALGRMHSDLPTWLGNLVPAPDLEHPSTMGWVHTHSAALQLMGQHTLQGLGRIVVGLILGGMVALSQAQRGVSSLPVALFIGDQAWRLARAFDRIVFAQLKISLINTALTAVFVLVALPLTGVTLPFAKTLVVLTFIFGLLPVMGNLISNTLIVLVSLTVSSGLAVAALIFLVAVHKLEYFLNARIVGGEIHAAAWEILLAMLVMEAVAGISGVILAPIGYAYLKGELMAFPIVGHPLPQPPALQ